jgi:hypothetical protein
MSEVARVEGNTLTTKMQYSQAMAGSSLLPGDYRGKPANLLFALEYADALGIAPIHAITSIHVISGKPSASADLIAASVRRAGHKLRITGDGTRAVAQIIRADDPDFTYEAVWDKDKAQKAGLWGTGNWAKYPAAMLRSRAITEVARMGASDALFGVIYTPEELGANVDADGAPVDLGEQFPQQVQQQATVEQPKQEAAPAKGRRKPPTLAEAMAKNAEPAPTADPIEDLGEKRDFLAEAELANGDETLLRPLWEAAKAAGEPQEHLDTIRAMAVPPAADAA